MSLEPNKKIDDLLKRFVKKRREETKTDFELHPATRKMLQSEVARVFPKGETEAKRPLFSSLWPRLALAGAFTAMLLATVMVLNQPQELKSGFEMSQNTKGVSEMPAPAQAPREMHDAVALSDASADKNDISKREVSVAPASALAKRSTAENDVGSVSGIAANGGTLGTKEEFKKTDSLGLSELRDDLPSVRSEATTNSVKFYSYGLTNEIDRLQTRGAAAAAVSIPAPGSPPASHPADVLAQNRWKFVQRDLRAKYRRNLLSPAQPAVLQSFEITREGNKIQLFDSDGSVYEGEILIATADKSDAEEAKQKKEQPENFAFRVTGSNQQINQIVTFTGNLVVADVSQAAAKTPATEDLQSGKFARQSGIVVGNGMIQGRVSVGGTNEFEIQATESPR